MAQEKDDMEKLRDQLQQVVWDNEKILEDRVFALATGSLAISLTIFQLQDTWNTTSLWCIAISWIVLLMSISLIMYSLYRARGNAEKATIMTFTANNENLHILYEEMSRENKKTKRLNLYSYIMTGLGIILTTVSAFIALINI